MQIILDHINTPARWRGVGPGLKVKVKVGVGKRVGSVCVTRARVPGLISTLILPPPRSLVRQRFMSCRLFSLVQTLRHSVQAAYLRPPHPFRAASTAAAAKAADNLQSLIREKLNGVSHTLSDITAYADWSSIEKEAEGLKSQLQVRMSNTGCVHLSLLIGLHRTRSHGRTRHESRWPCNSRHGSPGWRSKSQVIAGFERLSLMYVNWQVHRLDD